jgi:rhomboid family GlyGly-CTERM serine protease
VATFEPVAVWLQFDRQAIADGQWWRLLTGHLTHFGWLHLISNLLYLMAFTLLLKGRSLPGWWGCFVFSAFFVPVALLLETPGLDQYRGLSALLYGLTVWCALVLAADGRRFLFAIPLLVTVFIVLDIAGVVRGRILWSGVATHPAAHLYAVLAALMWYLVRLLLDRKPG